MSTEAWRLTVFSSEIIATVVEKWDLWKSIILITEVVFVAVSLLEI
jgi:hypothetical protein